MKKTKLYKIEKKFLVVQLIALILSLIIFFLVNSFIKDLAMAIIFTTALGLIVAIIGIGGSATGDDLLERIAGAAGAVSVAGIAALGILLWREIIIIPSAKYGMSVMLAVGSMVIIPSIIITVNAATEHFTIEIKCWRIYLAYLIQIIAIGILTYLFL